MGYPIKLDDWVRIILVDPLSKTPLRWEESRVCSDYGRTYPIVESILDLRLLSELNVSADAKLWAEGQSAYEEWDLIASEKSSDKLRGEVEGVQEIYEAFPIKGRCLDVGGHQGRLRAFLKREHEYVVLDPFLHVFRSLSKHPELIQAYPFLLDPVNFVCGMAEHLPFMSCEFDTVHMRSVIDHLRSPELALLEAYRVLKDDGQLIVGLWVEGGRLGKRDFKEIGKDVLRGSLSAIGIHRFEDHHVWHPTFQELRQVIEASGFVVTDVHWQKQWNDRVCYVRAHKKGLCACV